jgi:hypothetical protein
MSEPNKLDVFEREVAAFVPQDSVVILTEWAHAKAELTASKAVLEEADRRHKRAIEVYVKMKAALVDLLSNDSF